MVKEFLKNLSLRWIVTEIIYIYEDVENINSSPVKQIVSYNSFLSLSLNQKIYLRTMWHLSINKKLKIENV